MNADASSLASLAETALFLLKICFLLWGSDDVKVICPHLPGAGGSFSSTPNEYGQTPSTFGGTPQQYTPGGTPGGTPAAAYTPGGTPQGAAICTSELLVILPNALLSCAVSLQFLLPAHCMCC